MEWREFKQKARELGADTHEIRFKDEPVTRCVFYDAYGYFYDDGLFLNTMAYGHDPENTIPVEMTPEDFINWLIDFKEKLKNMSPKAQRVQTLMNMYGLSVVKGGKDSE